MMRLSGFKIIFVIFFGIPNTTLAASIYVEPIASSSHKFIVLSGEIRSGDADKFSDAASRVKDAIVILDSPGGSVLDGLAIGRIIRSKQYATAVPERTLCASSCALIWLAGAMRFAEPSSIIGFHAAYIYKMGKPVETGAGNALVGSYLHSLGFSDRAIVFVTSAPPQGIELLTRQKANTVGITYLSSTDTHSSKVAPELPRGGRRIDLGVRENKYDPIGTVKKFYAALSIADGDAAAALVIPEKRGVGPFNEQNIARYFGNMAMPLRVDSVRQLDADTIEVRYTYRVTESVCSALATVRTEFMLGNTLISGIKANC